MNKKYNRLAGEKSPYLLQHAENPVDWYPWTQEAFDEAAKRDVPVLLSIGYSVCHWCHVMAHESFEDTETAALINENFVAVKVDREERPDIDAVYMSVCQAMTGSGGWPLTVIMTPDKKPFFAGTYFPKHGSYGRPGLTELLTAISKKWHDDRSSLLNQSDRVITYLTEQASNVGNATAEDASPVNSSALIDAATDYYSRAFDHIDGGFGTAPKFPSPHNLLFLLAQNRDDCTAMAEKTLTQMYRGGIFDHIGGGFARYSTDDKWLVPHFEKMLYDNALLLYTYGYARSVTGKELYGRIAQRIVDYVSRELTHPDGGFYCSQDADSEGEEGKFYVFTPAEIIDILGEEEGRAFCRRYDITERGNFEGKNIPNLLKMREFHDFSNDRVLSKLRLYRQQRTFLHKDDKILTGWNGLMIAALAASARNLHRDEYLEPARKAVNFLWENLCETDSSGSIKLLARWREGQADFAGTLEDYAFFAWGLIECYASTFDAHYLEKAVLTAKQMLKQFFDREKGGCWLYTGDGEQLFVRPKETYDGAIPSGNSVAALVMRKLAFLTGDSLWHEAWKKQADFLSQQAMEYPAGQSFFLWQLAEEHADRGQLICAATEMPDIGSLWDLHLDILVKTEGNAASIQRTSPFLADYPLPESGAMYYYCQGQTCRPPVKTPEEVLAKL